MDRTAFVMASSLGCPNGRSAASHRPYRPSLELQRRAIDEIRENSGIPYDEQVVAIFLRLIEEKRLPVFADPPEKVAV